MYDLKHPNERSYAESWLRPSEGGPGGRGDVEAIAAGMLLVTYRPGSLSIACFMVCFALSEMALLRVVIALRICFGTALLTGWGASPPARLLRLLSGGEMECQQLQLLILDLAPDAKQRTLLDMKEVREDVVNLHTQLMAPLLASGQLRIGFM